MKDELILNNIDLVRFLCCLCSFTVQCTPKQYHNQIMIRLVDKKQCLQGYNESYRKSGNS